MRLAENRRIAYAPIDPVHSRELMIRDGLVPGAVPRYLPFLEHNLELTRQLLEREARGRRRDLLVNDDTQLALYEARLPEGLCTWNQVEKWWRSAGEAERAALFFAEGDLTPQPEVAYGEEDYPSELVVRDAVLPLKYRFAPGEPDDGVSVEVPLGLLNALVSEALDWSVPGFFPAVCEQWLKSLPKGKRKHLAPVPEKVAELLPLLTREGRYRQGRLNAALASAVEDLYGVRVSAADWDRSRIDPHLLVNVKVLGQAGELLEQSRDLDALKQRFAVQVRNLLAEGLPAELERTGLTRFPAGVELGATTVLEEGAGQVVVFPALVDETDHVDLKLLGSADAQQRANRRGYARLALLQAGSVARQLKKRIDRERELGLHYASLGPARLLYDEVLRGAAWYCFFEERPLPQTAEAFSERIAGDKQRLLAVFESVLEIVREIFRRRFAVARLLDSMSSPAYAAAVEDTRAHLARLVPADVLGITPRAYLAEIPRYLDGIAYRLTHLQGKVARDQELIGVTHAFQDRLERLGDALGPEDPDWQRARFALEELRLGLFAEPMGTRGKVSPKRLDAEFLALERSLGLV